MQKQFEQVGEFQAKFGIDTFEPSKPSRMENEELELFRLRFLLEEVEEIVMAHGYQVVVDENGRLDVENSNPEDYDLPKILDGYVDTLYVMLGSLRLMGFHTGSDRFAPYQTTSRFEHAFNRVHAANMAKVRAESSYASKRGSVYDVVKPEGWQPANLLDLLLT